MTGKVFSAVRFWLALVVLVSSPALAKQKEYAGEDGGYLIYAVGTAKIGMDFSFFYHPVPDAKAVAAWKGEIEPRLGGAIYLKIKNPDFSGDETGHVIIRRLPLGDYVVDGFFFGGFVPGVGGYEFSSAKPFALPFTIRPGRATYIGSFIRAPSLGTSLEPQLGAKGFFVIADRSARDLPIMRSRLPEAVEIDAAVTDVSTFESPALRTRHP